MIYTFIIAVLFLGIIISLTSGAAFLLKDISQPTKRTVYSLGVRATLATLLLATIFYGLYTGQLGSRAPWDKQLTRHQLQQINR